MFSLIGAALFLLTVIVSFQVFMKNDFKQTRVYKEYEDIEVPNSRVCMSSDKIKVNPTIPIEIEGQVYYACCNKCLRRLEANYNKQRIAIDPYTDKTVKKSSSYIRLRENGNGEIQYFTSEKNYLEYSTQERE